MTNFDILYDQFLSSLSSESWATLSDEEIKEELFNLTVKAIGSFRFPRVPLTYRWNEDEQKHYFDNEITQREINVLLALMKVAWIDYQISREERFQNQYYDASVRTFSQANLLAQLNRMSENYRKEAKDSQYDYSRVNERGRPKLGDFNQ